jgi:hypothetical protein
MVLRQPLLLLLSEAPHLSNREDKIIFATQGCCAGHVVNAYEALRVVPGKYSEIIIYSSSYFPRRPLSTFF